MTEDDAQELRDLLNIARAKQASAESERAAVEKVLAETDMALARLVGAKTADERRAGMFDFKKIIAASIARSK